MGTDENGKCFFPLTSLQIGDLQSYLSRLTLFLAFESNKFFILVDNRPWLDLDLRPAHLWQLMVTKSRLSPFANTRAQRERNETRKRCDLKAGSNSNISGTKKFKRWFHLIDAAALSKKRVLLPVKKLRKSLLLNSDLHRTLYGFIVFEVSWTNVRGLNYLNELQTDTSMAIETKFMRRWEFDSISQASSCISSWFPGTHDEELLLRDYLASILGEVFYDAQEDLSGTNSVDDCGNFRFNKVCIEDKFSDAVDHKFGVYPASTECDKDGLHTPPPPNGPYKRRKIVKSSAFEVDSFSDETHGEVINYPKYAESLPFISSSCSENRVEPTQYRDVLILFRFNDHDLPFKLRQIIMSDLRLLTLLESGLPSWVIFLQSYPGFCHLYRPWMCPLARALYVLISVVTVIIGFYDLYKNVPVLKATASRLCGPLFDWIETWEMISRIKYLGTMLFLHNFEKAVKWSLMMTRAVRSFLSVLSKPMAGPLMELFELVFPIWNICFQVVQTCCSVLGMAIGSTFSLAAELVEILLLPLWFTLSIIWSIAMSIICPIFGVLVEILYAPIRLILLLASSLTLICSCIFNMLQGIWSSLSGMSHLASASEATMNMHEVSMWRSLWNDLFSQVFRALRSILNGFVAFFTTCNRHRLSTYNHLREFLRRLSCPRQRSIPLDYRHCRSNDAQYPSPKRVERSMPRKSR